MKTNREQLKKFLRPLLQRAYRRGQLSVMPRGFGAGFDPASIGKPGIKASFSADDVKDLHKYFAADDRGHYAGSLHLCFGMGQREFSAAAGMLRKHYHDEHGKKRWVWVEGDAEDGEFFSAPGPGLVEKKITDRRGRHSTRWVRAKDEPAASTAPAAKEPADGGAKAGDVHGSQFPAEAEERVTAWAARAGTVPGKLLASIGEFLAAKYRTLEQRYGPTGAKAVLAGIVLLLPVPGPTTFIPIAIAEGVKRLRKAVGFAAGGGPAGGAAEVLDVKREAAELLREIYEHAGEPAPAEGGDNFAAFDAPVAGQGLVRKKVTVHKHDGTTYEREMMVRPDEDTPDLHEHAKEESRGRETPGSSAAPAAGGGMGKTPPAKNTPPGAERPPVPGGSAEDPYRPDPNLPNPKTGLVDRARVGVPANMVPPPPAGIPRLPNLDDSQRAVESAFADAYLNNPDGMADRYLARLQRGLVGEAPNIFATDDAKQLSPDINPPDGDDEVKKKRAAKYNAAVHQTANALVKRAFLKYLDQVVSKLPPDKRTVLVTNGGCAAGKGSSLNRAGRAGSAHEGKLPAADMVGAVWDAAGEQNATENQWVLEECKKRGIRATFVYVYANPIATWDAPDRGVIRRAMRKGRMVDARLFADSYAVGAKNMAAFYDRYKNTGECDFILLDNRDKANPKLMNDFPREALTWNAEAIYRYALDSLAEHEHDLPKALVKGGRIGTKIWGEPQGF